jgi:hypothetical protein
LTDRRDDERDTADRDDDGAPHPVSDLRRPYVAPALIDYGTVSKLTQTGGVTTFDSGGFMMMMMVCL